jgi:HAD superfamily phosphatase (TIGR01668 family)
MLSLVTPHMQLECILELKIEALRSLGLDGLLLDLDCTLKNYPDNGFRIEVKDWVRSLRSNGISLCILSNATAHRIEPLARELGIPFVAKAFKPFPFGCHTAMKKLRLSPQQTALVGDQLFADILAGRLAGLFTILVRPTGPEEPLFTRVKRPVERRVLRWINSREHDITDY